MRATPAAEFLRERYRFDAQRRSLVNDVYEGYSDWSKENGYTALNNAQFGKEVLKAYPLIRKVRLAELDGSRPYWYQGLERLLGSVANVPEVTAA